MKRFLILIVLSVSLTFTAFSQANTGYLKSSPTHSTTDTVTNTGTVNQTLQINGYNAIVTIQPVFTKISGTVGGTAQLQGTIDGTNYVNVGTAYTLTDVASQSTIFTVSPSAYTSYRLKTTGTGTMATKVQTYAIWRKP